MFKPFGMNKLNRHQSREGGLVGATAAPAAAFGTRGWGGRLTDRHNWFDPGFAPPLVAMIVFTVDVLTPVGLPLGTLYVIVVLWAMWMRRRNVILATALLCSVMMIIAVPLSPPGGEPGLAMAGAVIAMATIWTIVAIGLHLQRAAARRGGSLERRNLIANELDHRVRNSLAGALALINHVSRRTSDPAVLTDRLRSRINGMLNVHSTLSRERYAPIALPDLVRRLVPDDAADRVRADGPRIMITPRNAESLGLVVYELVNNSLMHGALSAEGGVVDVRWQELACDREGFLRIELAWQERGGPPVSQDRRPGLGTTLIDNFVRHDMSGSFELNFPVEGCSHRFELLLEAVVAPERTEQLAGAGQRS